MRDGVKGKFEEFDFVLDLGIVERGRYLYLHDLSFSREFSKDREYGREVSGDGDVPPMKAKSVRVYCCANFPPFFLSFVHCCSRYLRFLSTILQGDTKLAIDHQFGQIMPFSFLYEKRKRKFVSLLQFGANGGFIKPFFLPCYQFSLSIFIFIFLFFFYFL